MKELKDVVQHLLVKCGKVNMRKCKAIKLTVQLVGWFGYQLLTSLH